MLIIVSCPDCASKLRVPDTAVGKRVKCSKCATVFVAEDSSAPEPENLQEEPPEPHRRRVRVPVPEEDEDQEDEADDYQGEERRPRRRRQIDDDGGLSTIIPYRNGQALAAYYCGIFSLIPCLALILGPAALILGILGLRFSKRYPTAKGGGHATAGIVLGSLTTFVNWGFVLLIFVLGVIGAAVGTHRH